MKRTAVFLIFAPLIFFFLISNAYAEIEFEFEDRHNGFMMGGYPMVGYDFTNIKRPLAGGGFQIAYKLDEKFTILLNTELNVTRKGSNYIGFQSIPSVKYSVYEDLNITAGVGYSVIYSTSASKLDGVNDGQSTFLHGFVFEVAASWEFWFYEDFYMAPQIGATMGFINKSFRAVPFGRVVFVMGMPWFQN